MDIFQPSTNLFITVNSYFFSMKWGKIKQDEKLFCFAKFICNFEANYEEREILRRLGRLFTRYL